MMIYSKLQSSRLRHQYEIFGSKSQTSFSRNATRAGSEEGGLFSQAIVAQKNFMFLKQKFDREGRLEDKYSSFKNIKFPRGNYQTDSSKTYKIYCLCYASSEVN